MKLVKRLELLIINSGKCGVVHQLYYPNEAREGEGAENLDSPKCARHELRNLE